jgi:hypothetical protein
MPNRILTTTYKGVELDVEYVISGRYHAATRETPAEYPETSILSIKLSGHDVDIYDLLSEEKVQTLRERVEEDEQNSRYPNADEDREDRDDFEDQSDDLTPTEDKEP